MKVLPFYTATGMRDAERVNSQDALLCPTWKFLPFQIQRDHLADTYINEAVLVDCSATETNVLPYFISSDVATSWATSSINWDTFVSSDLTISLAIEAGSQQVGAQTEAFLLSTGEALAVTYDLTLNSGVAPTMMLYHTAPHSAEHVMSAGVNTVYFTATGSNAGYTELEIINKTGGNTNFACDIISVGRPTINLAEKTTYDFITYNGEPLSTTLPYGVYYLRLTDDKTIWYSEWFSVQNIQPQLLTGYTSSTYDTFTTLGVNITSAIELAGAAHSVSNTFSIRAGEKFIFTYDLNLASGEIPSVGLYISSVLASNSEAMSVGLNSVELTATGSGTADFRIVNVSATNFALGSVSLRRKAGSYVHLEFTNARDFNNGDDSIYYADGFTQQAYLRSYLNIPSHETIEVGNDKNGKFEAEKLVSKYTQSVISYESRSMYNALRLLPLHTTIKILDEVGHEHTPDVGNVQVMPDWKTFDTCSLKILWNEDGTVWTNSSDNIS